ncbi:helix-turn-helix transcriptional regulator [Oceanospirillum sp. D5]|uniref:Helix-turn-helix transcriptional regulator n=2 Tax=Oceanospirillum sediminis TaxID=2760088 RepID=A0A839IV44_9GAMM|nr:helix-turn-helix transcriptional regulator [Oceanospirillum sediminis]
MYRLYCEKYSLHHSLMTISVAPENQLMHIVTLARHDADQPFTTEEKQIKECLVPCLIGALKVNILNGFQSTSLPADKAAQNARAVLDHYGNIIEAEDGFWNLNQQYRLIHQGKLPIPETLLDGIFEVKGIPFTAQSAHGLLYIQVHNDHKRLLSRRQQQVLELIRQGKSNKEIASVLQITEATVKNHVKSILKLTHCSSRQHLISQPEY